MVSSQKLEDKTEHKRNTALAKRKVGRRHRASWDKFVTNLEHETYRNQHKVQKILKQISKDIMETARIWGNINENVFLQYNIKNYGTKKNINESKLEWNSYNHIDTLITSAELE